MSIRETPIELNTFTLFQQGDEKAFRLIFESYQPMIFARAIQFSGQVEEAEEITQEAFVQLHHYRERITGPESLYPFLHRVAKRIAVSSFRRRVLHEQYELDQRSGWEEASPALTQQLDYNELQQELEKIISELPEQQQRIYRLNKLEEHSYQDIADQVGLSKNTVRNHLALASKFVRVRLDKIFTFFL
ncbi:RNA polymerase sigma factor [Sphingobacterium sp. HMA12]|uniref:RNA polymerase sigma factor n=1 Tax=Sphingobacterium sp. HMA12 TaxID=2050894 RepID=UPI000CE9BB93|nr:sigma-70 family RNA polymerase sigma factor [Sphingobacterium sp. HMA12]